MALRRLGTKLIGIKGATATTRDMSSRAMRLCKSIAGPSDTLEALMVKQGKEKDSVSKAEALKAINNVAVTYKKMIELYNEIVVQVKTANKGSEAAKGLKPLKL